MSVWPTLIRLSMELRSDQSGQYSPLSAPEYLRKT